jgi:hexokinase
MIRDAFLSEMKKGLDGEPSSLHMIPTYLSASGQLNDGETAVAVDIGGTNLRVALTQMKDGQLKILESAVSPVPGLKAELSKDEFFNQIAEKLLPVIGKSRRVGVCFSHAAEILPNKDGRLVTFSKEIKVRDAAGMEICSGIREKLREFNVPALDEKSFLLLNDTAAALFGGLNSNFSVQGVDIGLVLGTGLNIGYTEKTARIRKLRVSFPDASMVINTEAGCFDKLPFGSLDAALDAGTINPGDHLLEKRTGGVYLGTLIGAALKSDGISGLLSGACAASFKAMDTVLLADAGAFLSHKNGPLAQLCVTENDQEIVHTVIDRLVARGAELLAGAVWGVLDQIGAGEVRPAVIAAEGSTFYKLHSFKDRFTQLLKSSLNGRRFQIVAVDNATLLGTGFAALLNG